jgi:hypothetical protein
MGTMMERRKEVSVEEVLMRVNACVIVSMETIKKSPVMPPKRAGALRGGHDGVLKMKKMQSAEDRTR